MQIHEVSSRNYYFLHTSSTGAHVAAEGAGARTRYCASCLANRTTIMYVIITK